MDSNTASLGPAVVFGTSGAIGRALAARLAASGVYSSVWGGSRSEPGDVPPGVIPFRFDPADEASLSAISASLPAPPALVLVATGLLHDPARGIAPEKSWKALDGAAMAEVFAANTIAPALIAKHMLPLLPRDRRAVFAVLSARVGSIGDNRLGGWHSYRASKAALNMLVRNFAIELRRSHPQALAVALHPGTVDSRLSAPFQRGVAAGKLFSPDQSAGYLLDVLDRLTPGDSGGLYAWDGTCLPE